MALLAWPDYAAATNSTLSDPDGRTFADQLAGSILAWSARYCNRPGWANQAYTEALSPTDPTDTFYLSALPLDTTQPVTVSTYNYASNAYDPYLGVVRRPRSCGVRLGQLAWRCGEEPAATGLRGDAQALRAPSEGRRSGPRPRVRSGPVAAHGVRRGHTAPLHRPR